MLWHALMCNLTPRVSIFHIQSNCFFCVLNAFLYKFCLILGTYSRNKILDKQMRWATYMFFIMVNQKLEQNSKLVIRKFLFIWREKQNWVYNIVKRGEVGKLIQIPSSNGCTVSKMS